MNGLMATRWAQGHRTMRYPAGPPPALPARFRGRPTLRDGRCRDACDACVQACPTGAVCVAPDEPLALDTGRCLFCGACSAACPEKRIAFGTDHRMAAAQRDDLVLRAQETSMARAYSAAAQRLFGRSLKLRQVSAGGCNACEADTNVLNTLAWDLGRFGIQFVAAPRHADGLLITGPVSRNMAEALRKTYQAVPTPRIVIAVGACAVSGGLFAAHAETCGGADPLLPVDLYVPGCPPHPLTILDGLLRFLGKLEDGALGTGDADAR